MTENKPESDPSISKPPQRRNFLKTALAFSVVLVVTAVGGVARALSAPAAPIPNGTSTATTSTGFPTVLVANITSLIDNNPVQFNYPLEETPNIIVKLGVKASGGVGPDGDIVAFSMICQHLGCIYGFVPEGQAAACNSSYKASRPVGYCCCHGSIYDFVNAAAVIGGPAPRPVPQVILDYDSTTGDIYATGMNPPTIFGHDTGSDDVSADLQGGTPLS